MKKILTSLFLLGISSLSYSITVAPGVELVSEKIWFTGNATGGHVEEINASQLFFSYGKASAVANGGSARVNTNVMSSGDHYISIQNTTKTNQSYSISVSICAESNCMRDSRTYYVNAGSSYSSGLRTYLNGYYTSTGCKSLVAKTDISGDFSANDTGNASLCITR